MASDAYSSERQVAEYAAREAGQILLAMFGKVRAWEKGPADLLTEADLASQRSIARALAAAFPAHTLMAEEENAVPAEGNPWRWIVDPLDGTVNFAHGNPLWCVSIGLEHEGELVVGVVHHPLLGWTYSASKGQGTTVNGALVQASGAATLSSSLISTGFPSYVEESRADLLMAYMREFSIGTHSVRRTGSSAWNLALIAAGGLDIFYGTAMNPWDAAAGVVLVREAGGHVTGLEGEPYSVYGPGILASNGRVHVEALEALRRAEASLR